MDAGMTHTGIGTGVTDRRQVAFGNIWAPRNADYTALIAPEVIGPYFPSITLWQNTGSGGTRLKGDGDRYCDMTGNGSDDYVWMEIDGSMTFFGNIHSPPNWAQVRGSFSSPFGWY